MCVNGRIRADVASLSVRSIDGVYLEESPVNSQVNASGICNSRLVYVLQECWRFGINVPLIFLDQL